VKEIESRDQRNLEAYYEGADHRIGGRWADYLMQILNGQIWNFLTLLHYLSFPLTTITNLVNRCNKSFKLGSDASGIAISLHEPDINPTYVLVTLVTYTGILFQ
jgi:hypothetical protein